MAEKSRGPQHGARSKLSSSPRSKTTVNEKIKDFEEGEKALIKVEPSVQDGRPHMRFHGETVTVTGKRGQSYEVKFMDGDTEKQLQVPPVHLQKRE
ncbi:MAG: 50S ribosomal protein L21e [Nanohaloarchaea archaeon QH_8_44_6]|nr:hypothetical protein AQV86_04150 [Nanohaloarchaea archaeon SG9]PSH00535.1 MAG: 50S ribosomal protein L21e [Nanohaloarchaea archaeon SW_7_46_7]PSH01928.1 MAG: 50S ribosomal protein L21e [Nanohaloarchaea archaeon QH_8_44_6]